MTSGSRYTGINENLDDIDEEDEDRYSYDAHRSYQREPNADVY